MKIIIEFLFSLLVGILLITMLLITVIGSLWVLRVAVDWWLEIDYVKETKRRIEEWKNRK